MPDKTSVINPEFWKSKRVFLTGHTGFKGSWLSIWLQSLGAELTGFSLAPPTTPSLFEEARVAEGMTSVLGDVRDLLALQTALNKAKPQIVIHMAAQPLVRYSYQNPVETYAVNVMGTVNLLEAVRHTPSVRAVVNVTTDKCYENQEWIWGYRENEPVGGFDPYSNSKACSELVSSSFRNSFFSGSSVALATARAGNVIGGGDWATDRLVPDILRALETRQTVSIRNPHAIRPWQHVLEPLSGYLQLAEHLFTADGQSFAQAYNFGPREEDAKPVQWIVENMCALWGDQAQWEQQAGEHPHEANYLKLDISKAKTRLGWQPKWSIETTLAKIVDWHLVYLAKNGVRNMRSMTLDQIHQYTQITQGQGTS